jgi:AcrR family transcriptional regulator
MPSIARLSQEHTLLRRRILDFVRDRFLQEGFSRVPVDEIAAGLAMSKKTFYLGFPSKDHLVREVIHEVMFDVRTTLDGIRNSDATFLMKLRTILLFLGQTGERIGKPFLHDLQRHMPDAWDEIQTFRRERITETFSRLIDQGIREGYIRSTVNKRVFFRAYLAAIDAVATPSVLMAESFSMREAVANIVEIFFRGILTAGGEKEFRKLKPPPGTITIRRTQQ